MERRTPSNARSEAKQATDRVAKELMTCRRVAERCGRRAITTMMKLGFQKLPTRLKSDSEGKLQAGAVVASAL